MAHSVIAAQLYTLRDFTKTPADIAKTLARVRKIGYESVQLSALGPIEPAELAKILENEGLGCCVTHTSIDAMDNNPQKVIDDHKLWGCQYSAIGGFFPRELTLAALNEFIARYNNISARFKGSGITLGYHNHSHEFVHFDGKPALEILRNKLVEDIWFEIDTYWVTHGGGDPAAWITKVKNRIPCVHLKDMGIDPDRTQFMAEVGEGNLNWPAILHACKEAGVKWYIVEQDICRRDPFESLEISLKNLHQMGLE